MLPVRGYLFVLLSNDEVDLVVEDELLIAATVLSQEPGVSNSTLRTALH